MSGISGIGGVAGQWTSPQIKELAGTLHQEAAQASHAIQTFHQVNQEIMSPGSTRPSTHELLEMTYRENLGVLQTALGRQQKGALLDTMA